MEKKIKNFESLKNLKLSEFYKEDVLKRALVKTDNRKSGIFLIPQMNYVFSGIAAAILIFLFSTINVNQNVADFDLNSFASSINSEKAIEYISNSPANYQEEMSDYYESLSDEDMVEILQEMDEVFDNESSYLIENMAANTDF